MGSTNAVDIDYFPTDLEFSVFSGEEIKRMSVVKIVTGLTFDSLGHALPGGLYDSVMGPHGSGMTACGTCHNVYKCPGHCGHIELSALSYNPFFIKMIHRILLITCLHCRQLQLKNDLQELIKLQLRLIDAGYIIEAQELELYKSETVAANTTQLVKLESGDSVHPRIAELHQLVNELETAKTPCNTKTSCALRSAVVNAAMQRFSSKKCMHCQQTMRSVRFVNRKLYYFVPASELESTSGKNKVIFADECRKYLREICAKYSDFFELIFPILKTTNVRTAEQCAMDMFFIDTVMVTPPNTRPVRMLRGMICEHPQTALYRSIIENNSVLRVVMKHIKGQGDDLNKEANVVYTHVKGTNAYEKLYHAWEELQTSVDLLLDGKANRYNNSQGLKQVLEKKEGLIRKHMMGKRVNFAARTVITPDPNINVDEIGLPDIFARKLSYPTPVTPWNVADLRKMVINGPDGYPGANFIEDEKGHTILIPADDRAKRESIAKLLFNYPKNGIKTVHRHVLNGDVMLLNRQPSLHKCSIMAHKARILPGEKTFRLHYSNCKAYNADFDGDEMNAHLPQSELARAEAYNIVNVANNYLVSKDGTPLGGLIQDHVISGVKLSIRGRFFNREDYQQLVYQALAQIQGNITLLPPAIVKPFKLWSGKQIISTILINIIPKGYERISLHTKAKVLPKHWILNEPRKPSCGEPLSNDLDMSESGVIIRQGELLCGVLDKQQYGATTYGLVHCMFELYGGEVSTRFLTALTKVFTVFLQTEGFTLGVQDILVMAEADSKRRKIIRECRQTGNAIAAAALNLPEDTPLDVIAEKMEQAYAKDPQFRVLLDRKYKSVLDNYTNDINKVCLPEGLITKFPNNNLQLMVLSGAKGSLVNTMQISCLLGQIELEGKRPPLMISGKSLPSFPAFETSPKSGGFIDGRFMTGIQPQDFFFHCMAGREGLIDTAVKTSRSGYLQRCLIKHLEGLTVNYDLTVRDSDNSVVQFLYGEDGLDILKSKFFDSKISQQFLASNSNVILRDEEMQCIKDEDALEKVAAHQKQIRSWHRKIKKAANKSNKFVSAFSKFSAEIRDEIEVNNAQKINAKTGRRRLDEAIIKLWRKADDENKQRYMSKYKVCADPSSAVFKQDCSYGSISERLQQQLEQLIVAEKNKTVRNAIKDVFYLKNMKSLVSPGEPVGLLAAQSIGEPSTQMTLNTFHFAGRGEMNVTLGIPRLREILMMASVNIKTPSMDIPINVNEQKAAEKLRIKLNRVTLADVLQYVNVKVKLVLQPERAHQYKLHFQFLPPQAYENDFCTQPKQIIKYITQTFYKQLIKVIAKLRLKTSKAIEIDEEKSKKRKGKQMEEEDETVDNADEENEDRNKQTEKTNSNADKDNDDNSSDEEVADDDNDANGIKLKSRKQDETEYDDPDDAEELQDAADDMEQDNAEDDENADENEEENDDDDNQLIEGILNNQTVSDFIYDKEKYLWCQITFNVATNCNRPDLTNIIRELAAKSVLHQVDRIKRAIIYNGENDVPLLKTDGINIVEMFKYNKTLDLNRLYSNDIHAFAHTYGIEAAAQVIVKEVINVFKVYGIEVDRRHLSLIADYMTFDGSFKPMSRKGMEHSASPLQQISFESCLTFLKNAASSGRSDQLQSPSSRLMVGLPVRTGTGTFELFSKLTF